MEERRTASAVCSSGMVGDHAIEASQVDFKELAAQTRAKMHASDTKGQALRPSRKGAKAAPKIAGRPKKS